MIDLVGPVVWTKLVTRLWLGALAKTVENSLFLKHIVPMKIRYPQLDSEMQLTFHIRKSRCLSHRKN